MALDLGRSLLALLGGLLLFAAPACGSDPKKDRGDDDDDTSCQDLFDCRNGEICSNGECIPDPGPGSGGSGTAGSGTAGSGNPGSGGTGLAGTGGSGTSGTNGVSGSGSSSGGTSSGGGDGPSGGQPPTAGTSGSSASGSGGTAGTAECSADDPITCPTADAMTLCIEGVNETYTCVEFCEEIVGFATGPCEAGDGCTCGAPLDEDCATGVNALCACSEDTDAPCTDDDALSLYVGCFNNNPPEYADALRCLVDYVDLEAMMVDCSGVEACAPEEPAPAE